WTCVALVALLVSGTASAAPAAASAGGKDEALELIERLSMDLRAQRMTIAERKAARAALLGASSQKAAYTRYVDRWLSDDFLADISMTELLRPGAGWAS